MTDQPSPGAAQPTWRSEEGIALDRTRAFIEELAAQYGPAYTAAFTRAIETASNDDDQRRYKSELDAAIDVLTCSGWTPEQSTTIATSHVMAMNTAISEDTQNHVDNGGTLPVRRQPTGNESA